MLLAWPTFIDSNNVTQDIDALIDHVEPGQAYVVLDIGPLVRWRLFHPDPWEGHVVARKGGRCLFDFSHSPISPALLNPQYQWNEPYWRMQNESSKLKPTHDLDRFRYVFLHTTIEEWGKMSIEVLEPYARFIDHRGEWFLFESNHVNTSPVSADVDVPNPHPHSFRWLYRQYVREHDTSTQPAEEEESKGDP
jgi:hypothetical protein